MKRNSITSSSSVSSKDQQSSVVHFNDEDLELIFNTLSYTSFNNCITSNSLSHAYSHEPPSATATSSSKPKYEPDQIIKGIENSLKELSPELESDSNREKILQNGINKKQFKRLAKHFQEIMNTTTSIKERDEIILNLERECLTICDNDPHKLLQMLHLSTVLDADDVKPIIQGIMEGSI